MDRAEARALRRPESRSIRTGCSRPYNSSKRPPLRSAHVLPILSEMEKLPLDLAELRSLFLHVLDLPAPERAQLLGTLSPELREELQALLDYDQGSETRLRGIVDAGRLPV